MKKLLLTLLTAVMAVTAWATSYELVTSSSQLVAGCNYIIADGTSGDVYVISTEVNTNNRRTTTGTVSNSKITATNAMMVFTLGGSSNAWTFTTTNYLGTDGYLYNDDTSNNRLKVGNNTTTNAFTISFSNGEISSITCNGNTSKGVMCFNNNLVACYGSKSSTYKVPQLYKEVAGGGSTPEPDPIDPNQNTIGTVWSEDFSGVEFGSYATQSDLTTITSATFVQKVKGNTDIVVYKNDNIAGGTAPELFISKRGGSSPNTVNTELEVTINLCGYYGNLNLTFKSNISDGATGVYLTTEDDGVTCTKGKTAKVWNFVVPEGKETLTFIIVNSSSTNYRFDDFLLTGTQRKETITIGSAGYATYVAPCALDFTDNAIEAYAVSAVSSTSVTLTQLTTVPAGAAIIVKGETGNVPAIASADPITNLLVAATDPVTATGAEYVLAKQNGNVVFAPVKAGVVIPAGKAYLPNLNGAASLRIDIEGIEDGMETAISLTPSVEENAACYDLYGRRANGKGLMIQNGKVMLVK